MKRLLLIICLLPVLAFGQFSGAKKLLLQQGEYCQYGNLNDYTTELFVTDMFENSNCTFTQLRTTSLSEVKQNLDNLRNCGGSFATSSIGWSKSYTVGNKILLHNASRNGAVCQLSSIVDLWAHNTLNALSVGNCQIVHIENGIITYIEYY